MTDDFGTKKRKSMKRQRVNRKPRKLKANIQPKTRKCLKCQNLFDSYGNFLCARCNSENEHASKRECSVGSLSAGAKKPNPTNKVS